MAGRDLGPTPPNPASSDAGDAAPVERLLVSSVRTATVVAERISARTVTVDEDIDEEEFFSTSTGGRTVADRYDLEKAVPTEYKPVFREIDRYWVNEPFAYVVVFRAERENHYYLIEPSVSERERELEAFLKRKLRTAIGYAEGTFEAETQAQRRAAIVAETRRLLVRYGLVETESRWPVLEHVERVGSFVRSLLASISSGNDGNRETDVRTESDPRPPSSTRLADRGTLEEAELEALLYRLCRDFVGYGRIDAIKRDDAVEDISVDGYDAPVFVYHSQYEQLITNVSHGTDELDGFVVTLAQRSGEGISKRLPQVDATLPDGSRAQLTLGSDVSDHGTNYTIRQFRAVPYTPIDLINWNTYGLEEMAFLWLAVENQRSILIAGGTASGKTTTLNAISLFIPSSAKLVSIEDTREVELPHRNWIASTTRPSITDDDRSEITEYDLLEATLRQRPDYIVVGEVRGEEGRTLFQVLSTGHTTYTTFHADSVEEVLKRFTSAPIDVSKSMMTALDLVLVQHQTRLDGRAVRRNKAITEIDRYDPEHDEVSVQDVYRRVPDADSHRQVATSSVLEEIRFDRGWSRDELEGELFKRRVVLAALIDDGIRSYASVTAAIQTFLADQETILSAIANGTLEERLDRVRSGTGSTIEIDPDLESSISRPEPSAETEVLAAETLERAKRTLLEEYGTNDPQGPMLEANSNELR